VKHTRSCRWHGHYDVSMTLVGALSFLTAVLSLAAGTWLGWISRLFF
jgi:hypothetical protein